MKSLRSLLDGMPQNSKLKLDRIKEKYQLQLLQIQDLLAAQEIAVQYTEATDEEAVDTLTLPIPDSDGLYLLIAFLELPAREYTALDLLQIHATLPTELALAHLSEIYLFISQVNNELPFGSLCMVRETVCLRHIVPVARFELLSSDMLLDVLNLFIHVLGVVEAVIHRLNIGEIDHQQALGELLK